MNVYLNELTGIDDALVSLTMTNKVWTREKEMRLRELVEVCTDRKGKYTPSDKFKHANDAYLDKVNRLLRFSKKHITLASFIDFSVTVEGMHYAGCADADSHSMRYNNRIIRMSTRTKVDVFTEPELSDYYQDKIVPTDVALGILGMEVPEKLEYNGKTYLKTVNGYIAEEESKNPDAKRGLYMLGVPTNFIFRCDLRQWAHVYKQRGNHGAANPEVKEWAEAITDQLGEFCPCITRDYLMGVEN